MSKKNEMGKVGVWTFTIGVILALLAGLVPTSWGMAGLITAALVVLGLVVGFLNVTEDETQGFLTASVSVMIALFTAGAAIQSNIATLGVVGKYLWSIMANINIFVFPATIVVAVKAIYALAKD